MIGVTTNVVTSIQRDGFGTDADSTKLPALVASTARRFHMSEVSADKAYLGHDNLAAIEPWHRSRLCSSRRIARAPARRPGAACGAHSCFDKTSFWRATTSAATSSPPSRRSSASSAAPFVRSGSSRRRTRFSARCCFTTWHASSTRCTSLGSSRPSNRCRRGSAGAGQGRTREWAARTPLPALPCGRLEADGGCARLQEEDAHERQRGYQGREREPRLSDRAHGWRQGRGCNSGEVPTAQRVPTLRSK